MSCTQATESPKRWARHTGKGTGSVQLWNNAPLNHTENTELYTKMPKLSTDIQQGCLQFGLQDAKDSSCWLGRLRIKIFDTCHALFWAKFYCNFSYSHINSHRYPRIFAYGQGSAACTLDSVGWLAPGWACVVAQQLHTSSNAKPCASRCCITSGSTCSGDCMRIYMTRGARHPNRTR